MKPLVSVIMPVYNGEKYVKEAIESILNQTYKNFEFIIIDDCSTDTTPEILRSFSDSRIRSVTNEYNLRIAKSLNIGMEIARGKYIARMDADDISYPDRLYKQVDFLEKNPEIGMVGTGIKLFGEMNRIKLRPETFEENQIRLLFQTCCTHPSIMFRKLLIQNFNIQYSSEFVPTEDYLFIFDFSKISRINNLKEVLFKYRTFSKIISDEKYKNTRENLGYRIRKQIFEHYDLPLTKEQLLLHNTLSQREKIESTKKLDSLLEYSINLYEMLTPIFNPRLIIKEIKFQWFGLLSNNKSIPVIKWYLKNYQHYLIRPDPQIIKQIISRSY